MAAASRVQWASSRVSYERQACVRMSRAAQGPMTGSFVSQSMPSAYPLIHRLTARASPRTSPRTPFRAHRPTVTDLTGP
ncbi:hypothetical protein SANTM175S_07171 [Streptomyces antimycoticus]